jgi:hypothetical protein
MKNTARLNPVFFTGTSDLTSEGLSRKNEFKILFKKWRLIN